MRRISPAAMAILLLTFATGCGRDRGKAAAVLQTTPEVVFLIRDNEARCAKIGQDGTQRLAAAEVEAERDIRALASYQIKPGKENDSPLDAPKTPVQPSEVFKKYLEGDAAEELAAADAAQGLIQGLLPQVKTEAPAELADAVAALSGAHDQVCLSIRQPRRSSQYQTTLDFAESGYRAAEAKLRPLYTLSATDSQFAIRKYGPRLDEARAASRDRGNPAAVPAKDYERDQREWQAAQNLQAQQEVEHESAVKKFYGKRDEGPTTVPRLGMVAKPAQAPQDLATAMKIWYPRYTAKVGRVKAALGAYMRLRNAGVTDASLNESCETLMAANVPLLDDPVALEAPDPDVAKPLRDAFTELNGLTQACRDGQTAETIIRSTTFEHALAQAAKAMSVYSLVP